MSSNQYVEPLFNAYQQRKVLEERIVPETMSLATAYDVQHEVLKLKEQTETLKGYKVSLTSEETQRMFNSDSPLYGAMTDKTILSERVALGEFNEGLLELELVFIVQETLEQGDSVAEILRKCVIAPGIELPDAHYTNWFPNMSVAEIVTDSAVSGAVVFGEGKVCSYDDIKDIKGTLYLNDEAIAEGCSSEVLGHPVESVKWLVEAIAEYDRKLTPGMFVSSGTFILPKRLEKGIYKAVYETVGEVKIEVQ